MSRENSIYLLLRDYPHEWMSVTTFAKRTLALELTPKTTRDFIPEVHHTMIQAIHHCIRALYAKGKVERRAVLRMARCGSVYEYRFKETV